MLCYKLLVIERPPSDRAAGIDRFTRAVGLPPMEYLLAWRMALAKDLLRQRNSGLAEVAEQVGYRSASAFSTAFSRHVGQPPSHYARKSQNARERQSTASSPDRSVIDRT